MMSAQKVTVHVDRELLKRAREQTGEGVTATIRKGLELVAPGQVYERLRALRGKVAFSINVRELRKDRR
jgi:post-segregation antitoxin (ccd killing protein)